MVTGVQTCALPISANAWPLGTEEGRTERRNATGSGKDAKIRRYPNGGTRHPS